MPGTPYIEIDEKILRENIREMSQLASRNQVALRPHIKTHKIPSIAKMQIAEGAVGITVAKISEAKVMASYGIDDIFIAYPIVTEDKVEEVCELNKNLKNLLLGVDSIEGARALNQGAEKAQQHLQVRLEIDSGLARTGVDLHQVTELAGKINEMEYLSLQGIFTFKGPVFKGKSTTDLQQAGIEEGELMVEAAAQLKRAGIEVKDISAGSTPTASSVSTVKGVTEIRPGTYVFNDSMQVKLGVSDWQHCAAQVVTTVVSRPTNKRAVIDGGSKTFATDVQPGHAPLNLEGFGEIINFSDCVFARMNEEHGVILTEHSNLQIGDQVRIIPNHICSTINLHNFVYLNNGEMEVEKVSIEARGKLQ
ncbi:alanine racemase [Halobacillus salinarum]|uniref:Alanine racemase n=1 Tax=Halobacillus salinarum TaxID=2932257 RepID=A0ABY4EIB9_9BACI|nr:alanine racemase [Halobacillus salinarum]UOQ44197.1 alanine racemase [Halobacillus salinarum]